MHAEDNIRQAVWQPNQNMFDDLPVFSPSYHFIDGIYGIYGIYLLFSFPLHRSCFKEFKIEDGP